MKFWQSIAFVEPEQTFDVARICEELGFHGVMISDHLLHFEQLRSPYPYSADGTPPSFAPETPWPDSWSLIAALAAITTRLRFFTSVYILPLRNPVEVAKATSSVATFCDGRVILGAGAGWLKEEFDVLGVDFATRGKRFDEAIAVLRKLWTGQMVEHHGKFFHFPRVQMRPVPRQPIPIYIGGKSTGALRRAARLGDGWLAPGYPAPEDAAPVLRRLDTLRAEAGRGGAPFNTIVPLPGRPQLEPLKRLRDLGADGYGPPVSFVLGPRSPLEQKRAYLEQVANDVMAKL